MAEAKKQAVIFGTGEAGRAAFHRLRNDYNLIAFADNDPAKHGSTLEGLPVWSAQQLCDSPVEQILIASEYFEQIQQQLIGSLGIAPQRVTTLSACDIAKHTFAEQAGSAERAEKILLWLCEQLNQADIEYYVDAGTLLGIYRDDALIPWDDDLDIAIPATMVERTHAYVESCLPQLNALTGAAWQLAVHHSGQAFGAVAEGAVRSLKLIPDDENWPKLDFFVKYIAADVMDYTLASRGIRMPSYHMQERYLRDFHGQAVYLPGDTEAYLERHYGDWKTPQRNWHLGMLKNATVFE